ncbi:MAG: hypothetical protein ACLFSQ_12390 [Candidatus Zixiibacteriota bacterium]
MIYIVIGILVFAVSGFLLIYSIKKQNQIEPPPEHYTDADIQILAIQGKKLQAIKWYKMLHNCSLKEAKESFEKMMPYDN